MNWSKAVDGLQFDNQRITHDEVQTAFANATPLIVERYGNLAGKRNAAKFQFHAERFLIDGLKKAGTKQAMDLDGSANHLVRKPIYFCARFSPASLFFAFIHHAFALSIRTWRSWCLGGSLVVLYGGVSSATRGRSLRDLRPKCWRKMRLVP